MRQPHVSLSENMATKFLWFANRNCNCICLVQPLRETIEILLRVQGGETAELSKKFTSSNRIIYIPLFSVAHLDCNYTIYTCVLIICLDHLCWSFWGITTFFGISLIQFPLVHGGDFIPVWFGNSCSTYHISVYWLSFFQTLINTVGWFIWRIVTKATINHHC